MLARAARPREEAVPVLAAPAAEQASAAAASAILLLVPVVVEVEAVLGRAVGALALAPPAQALLRVTEADRRALLDGVGDGAEARVDVVVLEGPDARGGVLRHGLGVVGDLVPALPQPRVLEERHD